ncbi:DegT/DnrJ/EryC1/StrS family aminotransferase [Escherichia coli]|uniref:DegT/DnrJ/EryC1/StrS aminotransferase family protein n=1 Tax=Escherichia coli TaxID=562 RepID=UPI00053AEE86|nr:DegT/DnrJ/EryC1/StrS family aminotransferase [Escherichia coli]EEQ1797871.1 DegT/DnrJ/EryC1/StrS family aminotransferase [Escherichia coli]EEQ3114284.1 DegT/DnrJ/EryC1/StrS family aminotransferase [Escherichia coli]EEQ5480815.1 DegT/DnrJ/EryC1/StrS family aminotransferase [Escherichia coli]EEQ7194677.1 DegT/DnrJ/EryC1/StrS family aminotransferase [Escherichia coli]EEQ8115748.1 DegT/DnrJ/EryC1/StrS family aminotransferase [Escherichia coli]
MITYPLASNTWDEYEYAAIQSVIDSKMFTMGKKVELYEKNFADLFGSKYAVMVSSGSTANLLMIAALFFTNKPKLKRGDEIIVPAVSWSTTYYPLQQYGLKVKFVDINKETLNIDIDSLKNAISDKTKAILTVNLLGNPNDFAKINEVINNRDIILLEDNCESMGAVFQNKQAGTFGVMGTFSSFYSHHIATMEGGCVVTDDEELYHVLLCLRAHGWTRNLPKENMVTGTKSDDIFDESFKFVLPGYNVRPLEMSGAIGIEQLKKLPGFISTRRSNAQYFVDKFKDHPFLDIQKEVGESSWFGFSFVIKEGAAIERKSLVNNLISAGIECRPIVTGNFLKNERVLSYFDYSVHDTVANAEYIDKNGFFVGNHQIPLFNEIDYLRKVLK